MSTVAVTIAEAVPCALSTSIAECFIWRGDNIGFSDGAAIIHFDDQFGSRVTLNVAETLLLTDQIEGHGLTRIVLALRTCVSRLHPDDLTAWREVEDKFPSIHASGRCCDA